MNVCSVLEEVLSLMKLRKVKKYLNQNIIMLKSIRNVLIALKLFTLKTKYLYYDELEDLFLISITHTKTGKEVNIDNTRFKTVNKLETNGLSFSDLLQYDIPNKEGYVVKFNYLRVKIKFDNYIVRHKRKTLSMNAIKRSMKKMERINLDNIPDECHSEVREIMHEMEEEFNNKKHMIESEYMNIVKVNDS